MASRRGLAAIVALVLTVAACTASGQPAGPTTPPDAFAPTPTIGAPTTTRPAPTTTVDVERTVIQRVDPRTLEQLPGFEPIPMGDWIGNWTLSPDRRYLAGYVGRDNAGANEVRLIDVNEWSLLAARPVSIDSDMQVSNDGTVFFSHLGQMRRLRVGEMGQPVVADLPEGFFSWGSGGLTDGRIAMFVTRYLSPTVPEEAMIIAVDVNSGEVDKIELPEVRVGQVEPESQGPWASYLYTSPSFNWDPAGTRTLVVHGDEDVVSEIDLESGVVSEHPFSSSRHGSPTTGSRRWSALSPDGRRLYVSTRQVALIEDDDTWMVRTSGTGVSAIDTTTWQVVARTDAPISDISLSPAGDRLFATGYATEEGESISVSESSGLFVLDPVDLAVLTHYPPERAEQWYGPFTFNAEAGVGYASTWVGIPRIYAIDLATGQVLATAEDAEFLDMFGPISALVSTR